MEARREDDILDLRVDESDDVLPLFPLCLDALLSFGDVFELFSEDRLTSGGNNLVSLCSLIRCLLLSEDVSNWASTSSFANPSALLDALSTTVMIGKQDHLQIIIMIMLSSESPNSEESKRRPNQRPKAKLLVINLQCNQIGGNGGNPQVQNPKS